MSIYKKLNEVMKKVSYVRKDGKLGFGANSFSIVTHDAVLRAVRDHLTDAGILVIPTQVSKGVSVEGMTKSGTQKIRFEAVYDVMFIDIEDDTILTIRTEAHAEDNSDKAANKAITYATKNALLKALMLETGDEDVEAVKNTIDLKQTTMIAQLIGDTGSDMQKFLGTYGIQTVAELPLIEFQNVMAMLQKKQKSAKEKAAS